MRPVHDQRVKKTKWVRAALADPGDGAARRHEHRGVRGFLLPASARSTTASCSPGMKALRTLMDKDRSGADQRSRAPICVSASRASRRSSAAAIATFPTAKSSPARCKDSVQGHVHVQRADASTRAPASTTSGSISSDGKIVEATSNQTKKLNEILDSDAGARYIGEFALGF